VLLNKHFAGDQIREDELGWACGTHVEKRSSYRVLVVKYEGRTSLERPRHGWDKNIKVDREGKRCKGMDKINVA
jgi:hypothetical protein